MTKPQLFVRVEPEHDFRVKVFVPWQRKDWILKIKNLPDRAWNKKEKYWSVPKNEQTISALKTLFGDALHISDGLVFNPTRKVNKEWAIKDKDYKKDDFYIVPNLLKMPRDLPFKEIKQGERTLKIFVGDKIRVRKVNEEWLQIWVAYDKKGWISILKDIKGRKWHVESKSWIIPYVKDSLKRLWKLIGSQHIKYDFEVNPNIPDEYNIVKKENKRSPKFQLNDLQNRAITAFEEKMMLENKAWRTIKTYKGLFTHFLAYFPNARPCSISKAQIEKYIVFKKQENISDSQLNQLINCLNCFFIRILNSTFALKKTRY